MGNQALCPTSVADEDDSFDARYEVDESSVIGTGRFAVVRLCWLRDEPEACFALKVISQCEAPADLARVHEEIKTLNVIGMHPGITSLVDIDKSLPGTIRLVMELCEGGELYDRIESKGCYSELDAKACSSNLLKAVAYIHGKGIMHRDLKPENILLVSSASDTDVKISDFGLAKVAQGFPNELPRSQSICGSDFYLAPEIIRQEQYGREVDAWALGVIVYVLLSGVLPFFHAELHKMYRQIVERDISFPDKPWKSVSKTAMDFILSLCCIKPSDRLTAQRGLSHPWLTGGNRAVKGGSSATAVVAFPPNASFGSFASLVSPPGPAQAQAALHAAQWVPGALPSRGSSVQPMAVSRDPTAGLASPAALHVGPPQRGSYYVLLS
ncbi:unnamed protein product [Prorocentrum cordatum]|uniref:Protein kinase domain-containing protein n=1 Tax=Prorocentrum cordatum TaxID=2364126 RepID=A0ABN9QUD3_9DINO|nr:unnamed protein product [Polarella glacialis]